jgi:hypothetical protein
MNVNRLRRLSSHSGEKHRQANTLFMPLRRSHHRFKSVADAVATLIEFKTTEHCHFDHGYAVASHSVPSTDRGTCARSRGLQRPSRPAEFTIGHESVSRARKEATILTNVATKVTQYPLLEGLCFGINSGPPLTRGIGESSGADEGQVMNKAKQDLVRGSAPQHILY